MCTVPKNRYLDDSESLADVIGGNEMCNAECSLVFRYRMHSGMSGDNWTETETRLWALECSYKVALGYIPLADADSWELASILCQCIHGRQDDNPGYFNNGLLKNELSKYLPCRLLEKKSALERSAVEVKILTMHGQYDKLSLLQACELYLKDFRLVAKNIFYGLTFFPVLWSNGNGRAGIWEMLLFGIGQRGMVIFRPSTFDVVRTYAMEEILSCGTKHDDLEFFAITGALQNHSYQSFWTPQVYTHSLF